MSSGKRFTPRGRGAWRAWLAKHHASATEVWLVFAKAHTGRPTVTYDEAVEEALCFGWIDGIVRRIDDEYHMQRFSPRVDVRKWSQSNLDRFARLEAEGRMTDAGRAKRPADVVASPPPTRAQSGDAPPAWVRDALAARPRAARFFESLAPGYRRDYVRYVTEAKREETRRRRLELALRRLEEGHKRVMDIGEPRP